jgi:glycosyltransferase involved in cell wall biosynthesis
MEIKEKKVAIVADWLTSRGGAERVIFSLAKLFPEAVIFTSVISREKFPELKNREVRTTWLQKLPRFIRRKHQFLLLFFPSAFRALDLSEFDVIISSSSSGFSKCVRKSREKSLHICYCHTPNRFLYHAREDYIKNFPIPWWGKWIRFFLPQILNYLEKVDQKAAKKVDYWIANSDFVGKRIQKFYNSKSVTIYPGVETAEFQNFAEITKKDYFLAIGRFIPYKKFDLLVRTFAANKLPLKLAGIGPELEKCQNLAKKLGADNIEFLGFVCDENLAKLYAEAQAFIFPAEEDFGLTPIEAMSSGTPVIFYNRGGASESVGKWGIPFEEQRIESLQQAIEKFQKTEFDLEKVKNRGILFDEENFRENLAEFIEGII